MGTRREHSLGWLIPLSRLALAAERLAQSFWPAVSLLAVGLALAVSGLLPLAGGWLHLTALLLLGGAFLALLALGARAWRTPSEREARAQLDLQADNQPCSTIADRPVIGATDPFALAAWKIHLDRAILEAQRLRPQAPKFALSHRDPWSLRAVSALLLAAALVYSGPDWGNRLGQAFQPDLSQRQTSVNAEINIEAWIEPPAYTGVAPIYLTQRDSTALDELLPSGSTFEARTFGANSPPNLVSFASSGSTTVKAFDTVGNQSHGVEWQLDRDARISLQEEGREIAAWSVRVQPDIPPDIEFTSPPLAARSGALSFSYRVRDDYGAAKAWAVIDSVGAGVLGQRLFSIDPIELALAIPYGRVEESEEFAIHDLTAHPWAGSEVQITLWVEDDAGQTGNSEKVTFLLPHREFEEPMAAALVEQRSDLTVARDVGDAAKVLDTLDALVRRPHEYFDDSAPYLAIRAASHRLDGMVPDRFDNDRVGGALSLLWSAALRLEVGELAEAQERLRDAIKALEDALADKASESELARLMHELRQALADYLRETINQESDLAESVPVEDNALDQLLQELQQDATTGQRDAARRMLSQLQGLLENLRATGRLQMPQESEISRLIREQMELADETQRRQEGAGRSQNESMSLDEIRQRQQELMERLEELTRQFSEHVERGEGEGQDEGQGEKILERFGQAADAMERALGELGEGETGNAVGPQMEAARSLRGAQQEWMRQQMGQQTAGGGQGTGGGFQSDPLGRLISGPSLNGDIEIIGDGGNFSARRLYEEIRRRAGDRTRQQDERDYLERLIDRF